MRIRRTNALFIGIIFILAMFGLYLMLDRSMSDRTPLAGNTDVSDMEREVSVIEDEIRANHKTLGLIRQVLKDLSDAKAKGDKRDTAQIDSVRELSDHLAEQARLEARGRQRERLMQVVLPNRTCPMAVGPSVAQANIRMMNVYQQLSFDNPDGGVWKQGYPISYDERVWAKDKLKVFIVPHSHNDPGWRKTLVNYFNTETRPILDNMLRFLLDHPDMRFVYAEMAFFTMWWKELSKAQRNDVRKLIKEGRLEIVTGGWVMNDEANTHYFSMVDQLFEGHQFLMGQMDVRPNVSWAIDPFGHSSTMAFLARKSGFNSMLIQRVHYSVKKYLSQRRELEYIWRQHWDREGKADIFTHMMPFYSYDVPHTCGPDPSICCQFDFARLPGSRHSCPWHIPPRSIHDGNIEERAKTLLDQYRKKATLYRNNVVLIPLGDDFRYADSGEWSAQYDNYKRLIKFMNSKKDWNVEVCFATLSDYFNAVRDRAGLNMVRTDAVPEDSLPRGFPTLVGDMFTYADRDDHYWSGYYTSRPYHKHLERVFESRIRSAEMVFSLAVAHSRQQKESGQRFPEASLRQWMTSARRELALFQHHDGVTGTGKAHVMEDYGSRMLSGLRDAQRILALSAHFILSVNKDKESFEAVNDDTHYVLGVNEQWEKLDQLPHPRMLEVSADTQRHVILFNSLAQPRESVITLRISSPHVEVRSPGNQPVLCQVDPVFEDHSPDTPSHDQFELHFPAQLGPLALERYSVRQVAPDSPTVCPKAEVVQYNSVGGEDNSGSQKFPFRLQRRTPAPFRLDNSFLRLSLSANGLLEAVEPRTGRAKGRRLPLHVQMVRYGARNTRERSGAYLFLPGGTGEPVTAATTKPVVVIRGPLVQQARTYESVVEHRLRLVDSKGSDAVAVQVENIVDVRATENYELAMRLIPGGEWMENGKAQAEFFTDLNCYQMLRREAWAKLPLQANVYPMPCAAMMEDRAQGMRLTVLSAQPLGAGANTKKQLDIFLDRRLNQDDNRGLGEGVMDNRMTRGTFRLLVEELENGPPQAPTDIGYLSATAYLALNDLQQPTTALQVRADVTAPTRLLSSFNLLTGSGLPCDHHLVNLKALDAPGQFALILHRTRFDCRLRTAFGALCRLPATDAEQHIPVTALFNDLVVAEVERTSLTMLRSHGRVLAKRVLIDPMDLDTFRLRFK